jgi:hypothetical protein
VLSVRVTVETRKKQRSYIFIYETTLTGKLSIKAPEIDGDAVFISFKFLFQSFPAEQLTCIVKLPTFL